MHHILLFLDFHVANSNPLIRFNLQCKFCELWFHNYFISNVLFQNCHLHHQLFHIELKENYSVFQYDLLKYWKFNCYNRIQFIAKTIKLEKLLKFISSNINLSLDFCCFRFTIIENLYVSSHFFQFSIWKLLLFYH